MMIGAPTTFAGYYYSVAEFLELRGNPSGESFMLGYVSGVHDTMAGLYPVGSYTLNDIGRSVVDEMVGEADRRQQPAYLAVIRTLIRAKVIKQEDLIRVFPESARPSPTPKPQT